MKRGGVSSPSSWPRSSGRGGSSLRKTENFRLDEPALRTSERVGHDVVTPAKTR